jgi:hypothetical protein
MANAPGERFTQTEDVGGFKVTVSGENDGQAIVIHPDGHEFLAVGFRTRVSWQNAASNWPEMKKLRVERVFWSRNHWERDGEAAYGVNQSDKILSVDLDSPQAIRVNW